MRVPGRRHLTNRRGATLPLVALMMVALLSIVAVVVDLGMLFAARGDVQRAADAAALAGASTYMEVAPDPEVAESRARDWGTRNHLFNRPIAAGEIQVGVDDPQMSVSVVIQRTLPLTFARIFGRDQATVSAFATARVTNTGSSTCIRPFGIPDGGFDQSSIGDKVLLWESSGGGNNSAGYDAFALVGNPASNNGVGHDIYHMLVDTECAADQVSVGDSIPAKPGNNTLGNVKQGVKVLADLDPLTWSEDGPYNGFNRPDWESDPRVALVPTYDPGTYTGTWGGRVTVTGFVRVFIIPELIDCHPNSNPCVYSNNGKREQLYAVLLPATGASDTCVGQGCGSLNRVLQLVK